MALILVTPPSSEPVTTADAALHLRQDESDPSIPGFISAARAACENYMRRVLCTQTWKYLRDGWPSVDPAYVHEGFVEILIPKPPFQSLVSLKYLDTGGIWQTLLPTDNAGNVPAGQSYGYQLDPGGLTAPARLCPPWALPWPPTRRIPNSVVAQFVCGYGVYGPDPDNPQNTIWLGAPIPVDIVTALKMQLAWLYEFRGDDVAANAMGENLAPGVTGLLKPYRNLVS